MTLERLDKIISSQGFGTRKDARRLINNGAVCVNGAVIYNSGFKVDPDSDKISVNKTTLNYKKHLYIMMNKPAGVVSASYDMNFKTAVDLLPESMRRQGMNPAGRLDKNTTGLLILTDDGDFAHKIISPSKGIKKTYIADLNMSINEEIIKEFASGVKISDEITCLPAELERLDAEGKKVKVGIMEGKYHQIKRMFSAFGLTVIDLKRISIGNLDLDPNLNYGDFKELSEEDKLNIFTKISR